MRINSKDQNAPFTPSVTLTVSPRLALDIATAMLRGELENEREPLADVVSIGVALCDVMYGSDLPIDDTTTGSWVIESSDSSAAEPTYPLADDLEADLRELARFRRDEQMRIAEVVSAVQRLEEPLELFVGVLQDEVAAASTLPAPPPAEIAAYLNAQDNADAQTSAVVAEAVEITKVAVHAAAETKTATADALRVANAISTAIAADEVAAAAARTAAGVQSQADATASIAAGAATDAATDCTPGTTDSRSWI